MYLIFAILVSVQIDGKIYLKIALINVKLADAQWVTNSKCWKNAFRDTERSVDQSSEVRAWCWIVLRKI